MISDRAIRDPNWQAQIPLRLTLASNDVTVHRVPEPLYVLAFRLGYLPTIAEQALQVFQDVLPPGEHTPWFEYRRIPLPWHVPIGVLYDILAKEEMPWQLTVHYRSFPEDVLLRWDGVNGLKAHHFSSMKEAACICEGKAKSVMDLSGRDKDSLWEAIDKGDSEQFWSANLRMRPGPRGDRPTSIPMRLYVVHPAEEFMSSMRNETSFTSRPVEIADSHGGGRTLAGVLEDLLPSLCPSSTHLGKSTQRGRSVGPVRPVVDANASHLVAAPSDQPGNHQGSSAADASEDIKEQQSKAVERQGSKLLLHGEQLQALVAGVPVSLDACILWLHATLHHPDFFLYVVVHLQQDRAVATA